MNTFPMWIQFWSRLKYMNVVTNQSTIPCLQFRMFLFVCLFYFVLILFLYLINVKISHFQIQVKQGSCPKAMSLFTVFYPNFQLSYISLSCSQYFLLIFKNIFVTPNQNICRHLYHSDIILNTLNSVDKTTVQLK